MKHFISAFFLSLCLVAGLTAGEETVHYDAAYSESGNLADGEASAKSSMIQEVAKQFGVDWPTLIAQMLNFLIVAVVLHQLAIKPILSTFEERQQKIADGLQYAEEMKAQSLAAEKERSEKIKEAVLEAQKIVGEARDQSKVLIEKKIQEATIQAESLIKKANEATEIERQKMLAEVREEVARLVVVTSAKVLEKELSNEDKDKFSKSAVNSLNNSLS